MRRRIILSAAASMLLAYIPAEAQAPVCKRPMLQGAWSLTCTGSTELYNLVPGTPPGTLVPFSVLGRTVIGPEGTGNGKGVGSIAGTQFEFTVEETFTVRPDCTGERSYVVTIPAFFFTSPPLTAAAVFMPDGREFRAMPLTPGDVVLCEYKKMSGAGAVR